MAELSYPWDGTTTGDANIAPYNAATEFAAILEQVSGSSARADRGGVFFGYLNDLAVSSVGVSPASVASGAAIVFGTIYDNSTSVNVAIPTPAGATRIDRIVLRKSWSAQTIRITRIAGAEGGAAQPITQTPGVTWDIVLAHATITTGGVVTITDMREPANQLEIAIAPTKMKFDIAGTAGAAAIEFGSKSDHRHEIDDPGVASTQVFNDTAVEGTGVNPARSDHKHAMPKFHRKYKTVELDATGAIDADLQCPVLIGENYIFEGNIDYDDSGTAVDLTIALSVPVSSTYRISAIGPDTTTPATLKAISVAAGTLTFGADVSHRTVQFRGAITIGADGIFGLILGGSLAQPAIKKFSSFLAVKV